MKRLLLLLMASVIMNVSCGSGNSDGSTKAELTCTVSVTCTELIGSEALDEDKRDLVPEDGCILAATEVIFSDGESVFDVTKRVLKENKVHFEYTEVPVYGTAYIEGIANLYEFDAGALSGWVFTVNGDSPSFGSSAYTLKDGDTVVWSYTLDSIAE